MVEPLRSVGCRQRSAPESSSDEQRSDVEGGAGERRIAPQPQFRCLFNVRHTTSGKGLVELVLFAGTDAVSPFWRAHSPDPLNPRIEARQVEDEIVICGSRREL